MDVNAWDALGMRIIGSALNADGFKQAYFQERVMSKDFSPKVKPYWEEIEKAYLDGVPIMVETLSARTGVPIERLAEMQNNALWGDALRNACKEIRENYAEREEARKIAAEFHEAVHGKENVQAAAARAMDAISRMGSRAAKHSVSTNSILQEIQERIDSGKVTLPVRTTFDAIDAMLNGGVTEDRIYGLAGPEKTRKTSFIRNVYLGLLLDRKTLEVRNAASCSLMCFENNRITAFYTYLASLISMKMIREKRTDILAVGDNPVPLLSLMDSDHVARLHQTGKWKNRRDGFAEIFQWALDTIGQLDLILYDISDEGGRLDDMASVRRAIIEQKRILSKPNQLCVSTVDYIGLVNAGSDLFTKVESVVDDCRKIASREEVAIWLISQYSREGKNAKDGQVYTKGSSKLEEAAFNYFVTKYDQDNPGIFGVTLARVRTGAGAGKSATFNMHPASGVFM